MYCNRNKIKYRNYAYSRAGNLRSLLPRLYPNQQQEEFCSHILPAILRHFVHCNAVLKERLPVVSLLVVKDTGNVDVSLLILTKELNL